MKIKLCDPLFPSFQNRTFEFRADTCSYPRIKLSKAYGPDVSSFRPFPRPTLLCPQKLSESMHVEMAPKGIHVQCQVPFFVATKLSKIRKPSIGTPSPKTYAKYGVAAIGYGAVECPYWAHKVQRWLLAVIPMSENFVFTIHKGLRVKGFKKLEAKKD